MNFMFQDCSKLKTLNVCKFDTRKVVDMAYMFSLCPSLKSLDLSSFDTSNVQYMNGMFADCSGLTSLDISSFEVSDETQKSSMFNGCRGLTGDLIILDGITRIDDSMYAYCSGFTGDLVIPDGVVSIGNRAFQYCSGLSKAVYLPDSVTSIGTNAFKYGAIILCNSGSYAEEYAIANNYQYGLLDEEYTITYHLNGGENHVDNPTSYTVITDTITLNNPIREGYLFKGWYVDPEFKSQKYTIEKYSSGNIELYAKWNPCVYSIEYYTNGENSSNNPTEYTIETDTIILENPTRKGYEFKGWFLEQEFENQITQIEKGSMGDIALYAKWEAVDYSITYHLNGGINDENNPSTYNATSSTIYLKEPTREGYNFSSWYEDAECTKSIRYILSTRYEDLDLYATWTPISYSVRFHGNGSTDGYMSEVIHLSYEETYTLPANRYEKTGHKFIGWNTKADGTGTWFEDEQEIKNITLKHLENVTLYAQWEAEQFSINYELNGGPNHEENPITYNAMSEDIVLKNPSREGYTFGGWYSDANFKKRVTEIKADSAKDITLYAKWTVHSYTIKFHANSGSGKMSNISTKYDKKVALTNNTFKRKGYEFIGWNTAKDGTGTSYINMEEVANLTTTNKGTVILYAQWKAIDYSITYELNAVGDETVVNPNEEITNYNITTATITLAKPTRDNYTFAGWYSDAKFKKAVTKIAKGSTGNKTLYAKWTPNKYTIKFDKNDPAATGKMSNQKNLAFDKEYTLTKVGFSKKGYNFIGWATEETKNLENLADRVVYTNKDVVKGHTTENGATVILYAVWEEAEYTITYNLNGGTEAIDEEGNPVNPDTYQMDSETIKLAVPTKPGYTFAYWCSDAKLKKKVSDTIKLGSTGNKTFYAKWTANKYTIKFDKSEEEGVTITGSMKNQSMTYGKETALTAVGFKRAGYELAGWTKTKGSQVAEYANKEKVSNLTTEKGGVVTLYAVWKVADYDIIYKNGGTHDNPTSYVLGSTETITLEAPTKEGYDFAGWYSDAKFKKPIKDNKIDLTGKKANITVYAKWTAHKYTIKFDKNVEEDVVVTGTMKDMPNRSYGKSYTLTANTYKRAGYKFLGWSVSADGSTGLIKNKAKVSNLTKLVGKADETEDVVVTLYAQWEIIDYIITYKTGGEVNPNPSTYNVDMEEDINLQNPTREGYTFVGWYTDKNCKKKVSTPAIKAGSTGNKTFYAKWAANKYTITYDQNLGEGAMKVTGTMKDVKNVAYGKTVTLANNTYKRTGYKFLGWSTSADGSTGLIKNKAKVSNLTKQVGKANETENVVVTLYAQWDIIDYTIKYNVNGGILSEEAKTTYTVEDAFTLEDPTMDGYEFVGWYSDAKGTKEVTAIEPGKTGNLTLYAVWKIVN